jgi:alkylated DNA repair dioxygenase AlkB
MNGAHFFNGPQDPVETRELLWHSFIVADGMNTLFPIEPKGPPGFKYYPEFISEREEEELINSITRIELRAMQFHGYEAKRKVSSFGYDWSFEKRVLSKGRQIPQAFDWLLEKVAEKFQINAEKFAELLLTEYPIASVINWHRDAPPFDQIAGISLHSDCTMRFRPYEKAAQGRRAIITLPLERRSLYLIEGAARTDWEHSIPAVSKVRYSITLRTLKEN